MDITNKETAVLEAILRGGENTNPSADLDVYRSYLDDFDNEMFVDMSDLVSRTGFSEKSIGGILSSLMDKKIVEKDDGNVCDCFYVYDVDKLRGKMF